MEKLIYLASPYSAGGADAAKMQERFNEVAVIAGRCLAAGHMVFSPICHSHPISMESQGTLAAGDWTIWQELDYAILDRCDEVWVCEMEDWAISTGVKDELLRAFDSGKQCYLLQSGNWPGGEPPLIPLYASYLEGSDSLAPYYE